MSAIPIPTRRWTRREYERMIDCGILHEDDRVELVDGVLATIAALAAAEAPIRVADLLP